MVMRRADGAEPEDPGNDGRPTGAPAYEPGAHIHRLDTPPRGVQVLDQREITVYNYETSVPFDRSRLDLALRDAGLSEGVRFGVLTRNPSLDQEEIRVVLALLDSVSIRIFDFASRRDAWFAWQNAVVDIMSVRYFRGKNGNLCFTTSGGGARITDERLGDFHSAFLGIPRDQVTKLQFDITRLRDLCFNRFKDRLYMLRFKTPSLKVYDSIEDASFHSRQYIDPGTPRLAEVRADPQATIESFDSDVKVSTDDLATPAEVRFEIRGLRGALRLKFPKLTFAAQLRTFEEQARVHYRLVDETVRCVLDADYYARRRLSLADIAPWAGLPGLADPAPYAEALSVPETREHFFQHLDLASDPNTWQPHLRAIDELLMSPGVRSHIDGLAVGFIQRDPTQAMVLLERCYRDPPLPRLGTVLADALHAQIRHMPLDTRFSAEALLVTWAVAHEVSDWDIDPQSGELGVRSLRWKVEDLRADVLPTVLAKVLTVIHGRLMTGPEDIAGPLAQFTWCALLAQSIPPQQPDLPNSVSLIANGIVPTEPRDPGGVLRKPVESLAALDDAVWKQWGLALWPYLSAVRAGEKIVLTNAGVGAALRLAANATPKASTPQVDSLSASDLLPNGTREFSDVEGATHLSVTFEKFGKRHEVSVPIRTPEVADPILRDHHVGRPARAVSEKGAGPRDVPTLFSAESLRAAIPHTSETVEGTHNIMRFLQDEDCGVARNDLSAALKNNEIDGAQFRRVGPKKRVWKAPRASLLSWARQRRGAEEAGVPPR